MDKRSVLATEIVKGVMLPQFVILPLAVLLVWLALARGIKPLNRWKNASARAARRPEPAGRKPVPLEGGAAGGLGERPADAPEGLHRHPKRFLADAAHQLKTPLAGLRMQADLAQREGASAEDLKQSLRQIGRSSIRATHTVNQLLAAGPRRKRRHRHGPPSNPATWCALTMDVIRDDRCPAPWTNPRPGLRRCRATRRATTSP